MVYLFEVLINLNTLVTFTWLLLSIANSVLIFNNSLEQGYIVVNKPLVLLWVITTLLALLMPSNEFLKDNQNQYKGVDTCQTNQD